MTIRRREGERKSPALLGNVGDFSENMIWGNGYSHSIVDGGFDEMS